MLEPRAVDPERRHQHEMLTDVEEATEHIAVVQALIDDLIERGLDPAVPRFVYHRRLEGARQRDPA